jgi:AcrR family transcriptional regulator
MSPRKAAALRHSEDGRSLREHLIAAAERLIAEHGTAGLTVRAIAREAGVADGVLYNHLADKEELLAQALHAHVRTVERGLDDLPEPGADTVEVNLRAHLAYGLALHRAILPAFAGLLAQPAVLARFAELGDHGGQWRDRLADYLHAEQELGRLAPDAQVDAAVTMLVGVCHDTVLSALFPHNANTAPPSVESVVTAVLDGIARVRK